MQWVFEVSLDCRTCDNNDKIALSGETAEQLQIASFSLGRLLGGPSMRCSAVTVLVPPIVGSFIPQILTVLECKGT
ncbi:Uncharacterized protein APZ42_008014 [Daphnia magna]|uniref:Uncharacterized protein n=1 Tax=Daphnia magna TaxID=35525 RepID=A0A164EXU6_9CRUS|nr:Uncharacterized protein APZ42_008014 [Daphnia magna]